MQYGHKVLERKLMLLHQKIRYSYFMQHFFLPVMILQKKTIMHKKLLWSKELQDQKSPLSRSKVSRLGLIKKQNLVKLLVLNLTYTEVIVRDMLLILTLPMEQKKYLRPALRIFLNNSQ